MMGPIHRRRIMGIAVICFGAGIAVSFLLSGYALALLEAIAVIVAGALFLEDRR